MNKLYVVIQQHFDEIEKVDICSNIDNAIFIIYKRYVANFGNHALTLAELHKRILDSGDIDSHGMTYSYGDSIIYVREKDDAPELESIK